MPRIYPVLLCGGSGTRLWPKSRKSYPKQFSEFVGSGSLFQSSARRFSGHAFEAPVVVTAEPFRFIVTEQLAAIEMSPSAILLEPEGRNTAPAVLASALWLEKNHKDGLMLVAPSDHAIADPDHFLQVVEAARPRAEAGDLVTFGIAPTRPETGYGYLDLGSAAALGSREPLPLRRFVEKPTAANAEAMVSSGHHLWNAGIFLFSVQAILAAFRQYAPEMVDSVGASIDEAKADLGFTRLAGGPWSRSQNVSIDYAIMEKARNLAVMPFEGEWSDLGGWDAVWEQSFPDEAGNALTSNASAIDCRNTLLRSESPDLELVGIGLDDIIAVAMPDAVLVAHKSQSQKVKDAVNVLSQRGAKQSVQFPRDHRPWGWFESLVIGDRFQVKRIVVHPGAALSLQSHHHRSEHWIVVAGTAKVTVDGEVKLVSENQSVYIPLGAVHRMENPGKVSMVLIEVQTGSYLGEDDITRYEDIYSRG